MSLSPGMIGLVLTLSILPQAWAAPLGQNCFEQMPSGLPTDYCGLSSGNITQTFQAVNQPIESFLPGFALVILWGIELGVIWFKTERIDLVGMVGLTVAVTATGLSSIAVGVGLFMLITSLGILAFQVFRQRVTLFT